jgi:two-component system, sensor histidine kinase PdtaS
LPTELRKTGISGVGDISWGTHVCHFYETQQDLLDILLPYFKTGLENNEFCLWVVAPPLGKEEARNAFRQAFSDADRYLAAGHLEFIPPTEWYLKGGSFTAGQLIKGWEERLAEALRRGYAGMRANSNAAWLTTENRKDFALYEQTRHETLAKQRIIVLCSYPLAGASAAEILDVVHTHQLALVRHKGNWEMLGNPELIQAKREIKRLSAELERRVIERTGDLAAANEALRREITERKRAEEALQESQRRLEEAQRIAHLGYWERDLQTGRITWSDEIYRIIGLPPKSHDQPLVEWQQLLHPEDRERIALAIEEAQRGSRRYEVEYRIVRPDGQVRFLHSQGDIIRDEQGQLLRAFGIAQDITERKQAEEALRRSEDRLRLVIDTIPAMVFTALPDGSVDFVNQRWLQSMGLSLEDVQGWGWDHTIHPEDRARISDNWRSAMAAGEAGENELRVRQADGTYRWSLGRFVPLRDELGEIVKWYGASTDIDDSKRAEERLKATTEQLRALSASLRSAREEESRRIAREIHDELGAGLSSFRWDLEDLDEVIAEATDLPQRVILRQKIEAMIRQTDTIVDTVRRIASELRPIALDELGLVEAIQWHAQQFQARTGISCRCECALENLALNHEQSTAIFRIFQEALTNILRHAQATEVDIMIVEEAGEVCLTISDNGRGVTEGEKGGQHSIGLLGMRERAHLIGGEIDITGIEGKGTVITVRVPVSSEALGGGPAIP